MIDKRGKEDLVVLFGHNYWTLPPFSIVTTCFPAQEQVMKALKTVWSKMNSIVAEKSSTCSNHWYKTVSDQGLKLRGEVSAYSEKSDGIDCSTYCSAYMPVKHEYKAKTWAAKQAFNFCEGRPYDGNTIVDVFTSNSADESLL